MKHIYLIGDSIRFGAPKSDGYGVHVKEKLSGRATVEGPPENCRFAQYTLRYLHEWAAKVDRESVDVVHWNNGLWDALRLFGDEPLTELEVYGRMLRRVHARIRQLFPNAKIIFATSTAVIEAWGSPDFFRYNREIEAYNAKACEVMASLGVPVNDLYALTASFDSSLYADWVHFNTEGCRILADRVIEVCLNEA